MSKRKRREEKNGFTFFRLQFELRFEAESWKLLTGRDREDHRPGTLILACLVGWMEIAQFVVPLLCGLMHMRCLCIVTGV